MLPIRQKPKKTDEQMKKEFLKKGGKITQCKTAFNKTSFKFRPRNSRVVRSKKHIPIEPITQKEVLDSKKGSIYILSHQ